MAVRARRSAHLAAVDALAERNHFSCRAFGNGKTCHCTGVWMGALRRFRSLLNGIAGRGCGARTRHEVCDTASRAAMIDNPVDPTTYIVGNVERTIRSHRQARGTMFGFGRRLHRYRESIRKYFALAGSVVTDERLKNYVVAALRIWR